MKRKLLSKVYVAFIIGMALSSSSLELFADTTIPLCFTAQSPGASVTFSIRNVTETIQMSLTNNGTDWSDYTSDTPVTLANVGDKVYFRAANQHNQSFGDYEKCYSSRISFSGIVNASGNIMSLYGPTCPNIRVPEYGFAWLFYNDTTLATAPELPATALSVYSYRCLFRSCSLLVASPSLPATSLDGDCYSGMFEDCTALATAPVLPATNLAHACYYAMFIRCSSLKEIPSLPANSLVSRCYDSMFYGCSSLLVNTEAPGKSWMIPADAEYAEMWNSSMFSGTGGTFTGDPDIGVTYYIASDSTTSSVDNAMSENVYTIYPNPIHIGECVYVNAKEAIKMAEVYNIEGKCVQQIQDPGSEVEIKGLNAAGIYFVKMTNANGQVTSLKLIVE